MNAHATITAAAEQDTPSSTALATLENIQDLTDGRDLAIETWLKTYDTFHYLTDKASKASIGGAITLTAGEGYDFMGEKEITKHFLRAGEASRYDRETGRTIKEPARDVFEKAITKIVDRRCWDGLMKRVGFDRLLDRQAREEFEASLKDEPPAFTPANCATTFSTLWGNRREMYLRGIANVFMAMDRRFRSHDAFALGNRLVIERAMSEYGGWQSYNRRDTLHDVERIFRELDGLPPLNHGGGVCAEIESWARGRNSLPHVVETAYFRVRIFKNGNLHLWFTHKEHLAKINELLLEYYKPVEGDVGEGPSYKTGPAYHSTPANHYGAYFTSEEVAEIVMERLDCGVKGLTVLEPSAGSGVLARAAKARGAEVTCVEIQPHLAGALSKEGFTTTAGDFLQIQPGQLGQFDTVVMNPPFDRGRDCDHVRHAWQFLKPGGVLIAIMSARAEFAEDARHEALRDLIKASKGRYSWGRDWQDLPERSFAHAGTNVNTVTLRIRKPS